MLTFPVCFWIPINFSNLNSNCSNLSDMRNLREQVKKVFCCQKLFWPFTVWINCSRDLKKNSNCRISKDRSRSLEQFLLTVGQNNFGNKIPFPSFFLHFLSLFPINYVFDIWNPDMQTSITLEKYKVHLDRFSYMYWIKAWKPFILFFSPFFFCIFCHSFPSITFLTFEMKSNFRLTVACATLQLVTISATKFCWFNKITW